MRARNIKPAFFKNEVLGDLSAEIRLLFIGLWCLSDREGRLEDRPKRIKMELFPYDSYEADTMLNELQASGFLLRYEVDGKRYIQIENFVKHQDPHYKEKASEIEPPPGRGNIIKAVSVTKSQKERIFDRDGSECKACGSTDSLCVDHIIPASRGGSSDDENLQILCKSCNSTKGNRLDGEDKGYRNSKHNPISGQVRLNVDSSSTQHQSNESAPCPLIPDSLIPDSLIPDIGCTEIADATASPTPPPSPKKGTRLPDDWKPDDVLLTWAKNKRPDLNLSDTVESFCNYWQSKSGKDACKLDWAKTFKNWVISQKANPFAKPEVRPSFTKIEKTAEQIAQDKREAQEAFNRSLAEFGMRATA